MMRKAAARTPDLWTVPRHVLKLLSYIILPAFLIFLWWALTVHSTSFIFPKFTKIVSSLKNYWMTAHGMGELWSSLRNLMVGYAIAVGLGIMVGAWLGASKAARQVFMPVIDFIRSIPPPVLLPLGVVLIGVGDDMRISVITFGSIWPILFATVEGIRSTEPLRLSMSSVFHLRRVDHWWRLVLPGASPHIISGMRTALQIAFVLIVISELMASSSGIGFEILQASRTFRYADVWAGAIVLGLLGVVLNLTFGLFAAAILRWRTAESRARGMS